MLSTAENIIHCGEFYTLQIILSSLEIFIQNGESFPREFYPVWRTLGEF